jgi:hypothetical protein
MLSLSPQKLAALTSCAKRSFAVAPPEGTGGFTAEDLLRPGAQAGLTGSDFVSGVRTARYENWG